MRLRSRARIIRVYVPVLTGAKNRHYNNTVDTKKKDPRGRKPEAEEAREDIFKMRLTSDEKAELIRKAKKRGMTSSAYVRTVIFNPVIDSKIGEYWPDEKDQEAKD